MVEREASLRTRRWPLPVKTTYGSSSLLSQKVSAFHGVGRLLIYVSTMVALPFAPAGLKIRFLGTTQGLPFVNVFHAQHSAATVTANDLQTFANGIHSAAQTNLVTAYYTGTSINTIEVTDISSALGPVATNTAGVPGGRTAANLNPVNVSYAVSWNQSLHYRGGHPRNYIPLSAVADISGGRLLASGVASALSSQWAAYLTAFNAVVSGTVTITMGMFQYHSHHVIVNPPQFFAYTGVRVHGRVDSQRRRLGKETGL
jgi:hypothetical protein